MKRLTNKRNLLGEPISDGLYSPLGEIALDNTKLRAEIRRITDHIKYAIRLIEANDPEGAKVILSLAL